jgi:hypothetical protein
MKRALASSVVVASLAAAVVLAVVHFRPSPSLFRAWVTPGPLSEAHAYLGARCDACHETLTGVTVSKCTACHATSERLLERQPTAFHASVAECAVCHVEHARSPVRPPTMDHAALARIGAATLARASQQGDMDSAATLLSLEKWLGLRAPSSFDESAARQTLACAGCHDRRDPHFGRFGSDCAQCHGVSSWSVPGYRHPSPTSRDCYQCHEPPPSHRMGHFSMVSQRVAKREHARVEECFECHTTTSWNDIVGVGFYKHH